MPKQSPIFGEYRAPTEEEERQLQKLVDECPVRVFQLLNKRFNQVHACISIASLDEQA